MYERILVPLDGSELAEGALPYVAGIARKLGSEVVLFTVCTPKECLELPMRAYVEKKAEELHSLGIEVSPLVVDGDAVERILDFAQNNNIGLITISTHGCSGINRWAFGSIANMVLEKSHIPVLLIRAKEPEEKMPEKELNKILIILDGSQFAESIVSYVEGMAKCFSEVIIHRVNESLEIPHSHNYDLLADLKDYDKDIVTNTERKMENALRRSESALRDKGMKVITAWVHRKPVQTILQYTEDHSVNLIAMSTRDFSCIPNWDYYSIASKIIEVSPKPLLLVRPPLQTLQQESSDSSDSLTYAEALSM